MFTLKLISIYYHVCDIYNALLKWNVQRFSINQTQGQITDEEIICIYLFCVANEERYTVKSIYNCILNHWSSWFPNLPSYQAFNQRLNRLAPCFPLLVEAFIQMLELPEDSLPIVLGDSMPIITCSAKRFVARLRQPIESFFNWINEKTQIQTASKVRSKNGLMIYIFGKIAAAFTILLNY